MRTLRNTLLIAVALGLVSLCFSFVLGTFGTVREASAAPEDEHKCVFVAAVVAESDSDWTQVNGPRLARDMERALERLAEDGYEVLSITPITRGRVESRLVREGAWGAGLAMTQGVLITAQRD